MSKKKSNVFQLPQKIDPEGLLVNSIKDVLRRLIEAEKVVLLLAKFNPNAELIFPFEQLQKLARIYAVNNMETTVGVRKMAREKWGMT